LHEEDSTETEKTYAALTQLYPEIPSGIQKAVEGLVWFFLRGKADEEKESDKKKYPKKAFDFGQDANLIFSAFYATYNISLTAVEFLHWWEFMALFEGLPENTLIKRVMYWRTADLGDLPKHEKKHVRKMRALFALKEPAGEPMSIEDLEKQSKERVARRFAEAKAALGK
jgi:hypothetical protein